MPRASAALVVALLAALVWTLAPSPAPVPAASGDGRYIIVLKSDAGDTTTVASDLGRSNGFQVERVYGRAIKGFTATISERVANALRRHPRVALVDRDREVFATAQTVPTGVRRIGTLGNATAAIDGVDTRVNADVAILDTGITAGHTDLNVVGGVDCTGAGSYADGHGHGTHVAGTVGALDNGAGVVGVAPGARLWAVKVLNNQGSGTWSSLICGIDWVTANAGTIEVANMSLTGGGTDGACSADSLHLAVCNAVGAGVTFVVAAGNEATNASTKVPATYDQVITVSALSDTDGTSAGDTFASFSNYGADIDIAAPGVQIYSTSRTGSYTTMSGTSMAAPHVAGAAALHIAANGRVGPAAVKSALLANREAIALSGDPDGVAEGVVRVGAGGTPPTTPTPTPSPTPTATATATATPIPGTTLPPSPPLAGARLTIVGGSATASTTSPTLAYDRNGATNWRTTQPRPPVSSWVRFDLGSTKSVTGLNWLFGQTGAADSVKIQHSTNGSTWKSFATVGNAPANTWQSLAKSVSARYVRFLFTNVNRDPVVGYLAEVEIWGTTGTTAVSGAPTATATTPPPLDPTPTPTTDPTATPEPPTAPAVPTETPTPVPPTAAPTETPAPPAPTETPVPPPPDTPTPVPPAPEEAEPTAAA